MSEKKTFETCIENLKKSRPLNGRDVIEAMEVMHAELSERIDSTEELVIAGVVDNEPRALTPPPPTPTV